MERSIYCSLSELQTLFENSESNGDWRAEIVKEIDSVFAYTEDDSFLRGLSSVDEESFMASFDGTTPKIGISLAKKHYLNEWLGGHLRPVKGILDFYPNAFQNGAICKSVASVGCDELNKNGIEYIDDVNDKWISSLRDHWYEDTDNSCLFSWKDFLKKGLPTSNSVVIIDRYIFAKSYNGSKNVEAILDAIIPENFARTYYVSIIFEYGAAEWRNDMKNEGVKPRDEDAIDTINKRIRLAFNKRGINVNIEYIAVVKPPKESRYRIVGYSEWKNLHNATHDRKILTGFFQVMASHALAAAYPNNATSSQRITYESLLSDVDNPKQKRKYVPFFAIRRQLDYLYDCLISAPPQSYHCYRFDRGKFGIVECGLNTLRNPLLRFNRPRHESDQGVQL